MTYTVIPTDKFLLDIKYYIQKKNFLHIDDDIEEIIESLEKGELIGDAISDVSVSKGNTNKIYNVRAKNSDTNQGKSNGYRVIYYAVTNDAEVYLLTVYNKKDNNRIPSKKEIADIIHTYCE